MQIIRVRQVWKITSFYIAYLLIMARKNGFSLHFSDWVAAITVSHTMNMNLGQLHLY